MFLLNLRSYASFSPKSSPPMNIKISNVKKKTLLIFSSLNNIIEAFNYNNNDYVYILLTN